MTSFLGRVVAFFDDLYVVRLQPLLLPIVEHHIIPDAVIRYFVRREIARGLNRVKSLTTEQKAQETRNFIAEIKTLPIAVQQAKANEQHYEVPDAFYQLVLGPALKYSSGYWPTSKTTLEESEVAMLELYCERAGLKDGMSLIDLGCGWGSVTLFMAKKYPNMKITSISNSNSQREFIMSTAQKRGLPNVNVFTGDINTFDLPTEYHGKADRIISIEMFEHS
jgi:cyclopropane-fatty-acyl-phospholipid synthase